MEGRRSPGGGIALPAWCPGEPKTCDVCEKIAHYMDRGFNSETEALDIRFLPGLAPGMPIEPFSIGYILGSTRAMAAVALLEALVVGATQITPEALQAKSAAGLPFAEVLSTLRWVRVTYRPTTDSTDLAIRTAPHPQCRENKRMHHAEYFGTFTRVRRSGPRPSALNVNGQTRSRCSGALTRPSRRRCGWTPPSGRSRR